MYQLDLTSDNNTGLELEVDGNRLYFRMVNDARDEPTASAIKIDSYDFTPLCDQLSSKGFKQKSGFNIS